MYRGNAQRTGNTDGKAGPTNPAVLWVLPSKEHFVASPTPAGDRIFISGLGPFNVSTFYSLAADPKADPRVQWTKTTPFLKLPTVSSPAVVGDKLIFGDGMHQTDAGATLYCVGIDKGRPYWQLPVLGSLVHHGGVADRGGRQGLRRRRLGRRDLRGHEPRHAGRQGIGPGCHPENPRPEMGGFASEVRDRQEERPAFALPPSEDQLPKPAPTLVWQQGKDKWHVDAPVTVIGDRVLVTSAFLDKEQLGDRACTASTRRLATSFGASRWRSIRGAARR